METNIPNEMEAAERFDALYQFLSRKYDIREMNISISDKKFRIFSVDDMDDLLDRLIEKSSNDIEVKDERLPYWAELWPSAVALSKFLMESDRNQAGANVLEIGCGIGLTGMVAAMQGAEVLLTDYQPDALRFAELNWLRNLSIAPATAVMDWRQPNLSEKFDLILGSDVIYEERFFWPMLDLFHTLLKKNGHIYLSEPHRNIALKFFELVREEGFDYSKKEMPVNFREKTLEISIYNLHLSK